MKNITDTNISIKKPFYKRWWFALVVVFFVIGIISANGSDKNKSDKAPATTVEQKQEQTSVVLNDKLRELFVMITPETKRADIDKQIDKYSSIYKSTAKDYEDEGYSRIKVAYDKAISLHKYDDYGDYVDVYFNLESGNLNSATYFNAAHNSYAVLYQSGLIPTGIESAGYYYRKDSEDFRIYDNADSVLAAIYEINLTDYSDSDIKIPIKNWIVKKIKDDYPGTYIDALRIYTKDGWDISEYCMVAIDLTWNVSNNEKLTEEMLEMYSNDLAATLVLEYQNIHWMDIRWIVPYHKYERRHMKYMQKEGRMYRTSQDR